MILYMYYNSKVAATNENLIDDDHIFERTDYC